MKQMTDKARELPSEEQVKNELDRLHYRKRYSRALLSTISILIVVAAVAVLAATLWFPVLQIYGDSMTPNLNKGEIVVTLKGSSYGKGDVVSLWYGNKLLVKRVIAGPGQWVDIDEDGNVFVDGELIDEPYVTEKAFGDCNIKLPYQVGDERYFVMGDHRSTSSDSRNTAIGCIAEEQIIGKIIFRIWPLDQIGKLKQ